MFEGRFSELLIIFVLALVVLGPEKLPRVVAELGRWMGRARAMARQFREQLEEEITLEEARRASSSPGTAQDAPAAHPDAKTYSSAAEARAAAAAAANPGAPATSEAGGGTSAGDGGFAGPAPPAEAVTATGGAQPVRPVTWSHAHPTDSSGANPLRADGGAEPAAEAPRPTPETPATVPQETAANPGVPPADGTRPA